MGRQWVYYIPELNAICIARPDWVDYQGNSPVEWGFYDLAKLPFGFRIFANLKHPKHNAVYLGEL